MHTHKHTHRKREKMIARLIDEGMNAETLSLCLSLSFLTFARALCFFLSRFLDSFLNLTQLAFRVLLLLHALL